MGRRVRIQLDTATLYSMGSVTDFARVIRRAALPDEMFDADGSSPALSNGGDLWASLDGTADTRIPLDIIYFQTDADPANGTAEMWVRVPDDTASEIWIHWRGAQTEQPAVASPYGRNAVWSGGLGQVNRCWLDPSGGIVDRTGNGRDLSIRAGAPTVGSRAGMLSPCIEMTTGDILQWSKWISENYSTYTLSLQLDTDDDDNDGLIGEGNYPPSPYLSISTSLTDVFVGIRWSSSSGDMISASASAAITTYPCTLSVVRRGNDGADLEIWIDGTDETDATSGTGAPSTFTPAPDETYLCANLEGAVSMFVVSTVPRDDAWIFAWSYQLANPDLGLTADSPVDDAIPSADVTPAATSDYDTSDPIHHDDARTAGLRMMLAPALGPGLAQIDLVRRVRFAPTGAQLRHDRDWGRAWSFAGAGRLEAARGLWATAGGPYTLAALLRPTAWPTSPAGATIVRWSASTGDYELVWHITPGGGIQVTPGRPVLGVPTYEEVIAPAGTITLDAWWLLSVTFDGTAVSLQVNGVEVATADRAGHQIDAPDSLVIGAGSSSSASAWPLTGDIAGVAAWSRVLPASDLARMATPEGWLGLLRPATSQRYQPTNLVPAAVTLLTTGTVGVSHEIRRHAAATLTVTGTVGVSHHIRSHAAVTMLAEGTLSDAGEVIDPPSACTLLVTGTVGVSHHIRSHAAVTMLAEGTLSNAGAALNASACTMTVTGTVTVGAGAGPYTLAACTMTVTGTLSAAGEASQTYAYADFEVPSWGEFPAGLQTLGGGVTAAQEVTGSYPDRGARSMELTCTGTAGSAWVSLPLGGARPKTHTRLVLGRGDATGAAPGLVIAEAFDGSDASVWALVWVPDTGALELILPGGLWLEAVAPALAWISIEVYYDADAGEAELWVGGILADQVTDAELEGWEPQRLSLGALGASAVSGTYMLDEVRVGSTDIGPARRRPIRQDMADPARWVLLANAADADSIDYANQVCGIVRQIPWGHVIAVDCAALDAAGYATLQADLAGWLDRHDPRHEIGGVLIAPGFPAAGLVDLGGGDIRPLAALLTLGTADTTPAANPRYISGLVDVADLPARSGLLRSPTTAGPLLAVQGYDGDTARADALITDEVDMAFSTLTTAARLALRATGGAWATLDAFRADLLAQKLMVQATSSASVGWAIEMTGATAPDFAATGQTRALYAGGAAADAVDAVDVGYAYAVCGAGANQVNPAALWAALRGGWTWAEALAIATPTLGVALWAWGDPLGRMLTPRQGYRVYERSTRTGTATLVACVPAGVTSLTLGGYSAGDTRYFEARTVSRSGALDTEPQRLVMARFDADTGLALGAAPNAPTGLTLAREAGGKVRATWAYLATREAAKCHVFRVYTATGSSPTWNFTTPAASLTIGGILRQGYSVQLGPWADGTQVHVIVRAESAAGGREANTFSQTVTVDATAPAAPVSMEVTSG